MREKTAETLITLVMLIAAVAFSLPKILPKYDTMPVFFGLLVLAATICGSTWWKKCSLYDFLLGCVCFATIAIVGGTVCLIHPWIRNAYAIFCLGLFIGCTGCLCEPYYSFISNIVGHLIWRH